MEITSLFGLPAHPFLVHLPLVLIPLAAAVAVIAVVWPRGRRPLSLVVAAMAVVGAISAILAAGSGEALEERLGEESSLISDHAELGEGLRLFAILFAFAAIVFAVHHWSDRLGIRPDSGLGSFVRARAVFAVAAVAMVLSAGLATAWTIQTGHSGAKAVWQEEWDQRQADGGDDDESRVQVLRPAARSGP